MGYVRGHRGDYDRWARNGLPGWSYEDVLPYFKRAESWEDGETPYRGGDGPLVCARTKTSIRSTAPISRQACSAGHPFTDDYNGASTWFRRAQWTIRHGRR